MYDCSRCQKTFNTKHQYAGHMGSHNRPQTNKYPAFCFHACEYCLEPFKVTRSIAQREPKFCSRECFNQNKTKIRKQQKFVWSDGKVSDKTIQEIETLKEIITHCEICGLEEIGYTGSLIHLGKRNKLSADHDHETGKFRGLLCVKCNIQLGWYEKYQNQVSEYLNENHRSNI